MNFGFCGHFWKLDVLDCRGSWAEAATSAAIPDDPPGTEFRGPAGQSAPCPRTTHPPPARQAPGQSSAPTGRLLGSYLPEIGPVQLKLVSPGIQPFCQGGSDTRHPCVTRVTPVSLQPLQLPTFNPDFMTSPFCSARDAERVLRDRACWSSPYGHCQGGRREGNQQQLPVPKAPLAAPGRPAAIPATPAAASRQHPQVGRGSLPASAPRRGGFIWQKCFL